MYSALPGRMTNEQLAHELLLDPAFKLDDKGGSAAENPVFSRIRESFHVAFWDSLVDDLRLTPPCYVRVIRVLSEIRDGIADLGSGNEAVSINQVVDVEAIREQVEGGKLEWAACEQLVGGIVGVLQRMQAPKRDVETRTRWGEMQELLERAAETEAERPAAFCKALEFVLDRVNTIRIDAANARLRMIAPVSSSPRPCSSHPAPLACALCLGSRARRGVRVGGGVGGCSTPLGAGCWEVCADSAGDEHR